MSEKTSSEDLKALYGEQYVQAFEKNQSLHRINKLLKHLQVGRNEHIADFGCGNGMLMPLLAPLVATYTGVDFSAAFIEAAQQRKRQSSWNNADFQCASIHDFCEKNPETFDAGFALDFSEHVYDREWEDILCSIHHSLKRGGRFYMHTPNGDFLIEKMKQRNFILKQFPEHIAVRTLQENIALLESAGFTIKNIHLLSHYLPLLKPLHLLSYLPLAGRYFKARIFIEAVK